MLSRSVPLLALVMPVTVAAPIAALVSITVAAIVVVQDWRHVWWKSAARLVLATFAGIPVGLLLLTRAPEPIVKAMLALVIITFSIQANAHDVSNRQMLAQIDSVVVQLAR